MTYAEYNFDGLIGPTHNYAGLSFGNLASAKNAGAACQAQKYGYRSQHVVKLLEPAAML